MESQPVVVVKEQLGGRNKEGDERGRGCERRRELTFAAVFPFESRLLELGLLLSEVVSGMVALIPVFLRGGSKQMGQRSSL